MYRHSLCRNVGSYPSKWEDLFRVVDLSALELVGIVDVEGLPFGVEVDGGDSGFAVAVAGFLGAAERQVGFGADGWGVHIDDAGEQVADGVKGAIHVARVDRGREAVGHAVGYFHGFFQASDGDYRNHRAEDFFLRDAHLWIAVAEHRRFVEPTFGEGAVSQAMASGEELGAFGLADLHVLHDGFELLLVDAGTHVDSWVEAIADFQFFGAGYQARSEFAVDGFVNGDPAGGGAALTGGAETAPDGAVDGEVEIGVVHHYDDVLAAHLEAAMFEFRRAGFGDQATDSGGAGEADYWNIQMLGQRRAGVWPVAADEIHNAFGDSRFRENLHKIVGG